MYETSEAMQTNQQRARALRKRKKTQRSYSSPFELTTKSFEEDLPLEDVKTLYNFLKKAQTKLTKYNNDEDYLPTNQYLDYLDAGGDAGLAWTRDILKSEGILKTYQKEITPEEINTPNTDKWSAISITKSVNEELKQATYVVLAPDEVDLHGDIYDANEVRKACHNFNQHCMTANLLHLVETDSFSIVESYISQVDMILGEQVVKAGSWLCVLQVWDDFIWEEIKTGQLTGVSVGCSANTEYLNDVED